MARVDTKIPEGDRPLLRFYAREWRLVNGKWVKLAIDLTGATMTYIAKATPDTADGSAIATINGVGIAPLTDGLFTVQITAPVTASPGQFWYKSMVVLGGNPLTVQHGILFVENT